MSLDNSATIVIFFASAGLILSESLAAEVSTVQNYQNKFETDTAIIQKFKWLKIVSSTYRYILMGRNNHSISLDATIMVSKNCPTIGKQVVIQFVTQ